MQLKLTILNRNVRKVMNRKVNYHKSKNETLLKFESKSLLQAFLTNFIILT